MLHGFRTPEKIRLIDSTFFLQIFCFKNDQNPKKMQIGNTEIEIISMINSKLQQIKEFAIKTIRAPKIVDRKNILTAIKVMA